MSDATLYNIVIGVVIGLLVTAFGWLLQSISTARKERKQKERTDRNRRRHAYTHLKAILDGLPSVGNSTTEKRVYSEQLKEIENIVADFQDVIDDSTLEAWYSKKVSSTELREEHAEHCIVDFGTFIDNVRWHYERFDKRSPAYKLAYVLNAKE